MQYSFIKSLLDSSWMIHPQAASLYYPLLKGALSGLEFVTEDEPEESLPYLVNASNSAIVPFTNPSVLDYSEDGQEFIFVLNLRGPVLKHDTACGPVGTRTLAARLAKMDKDPKVIGHILVTESGGGQAVGVPELTDVIENLSKPIVAWIDGMSASAAYYINAYCDHVMASRSNDSIGCIGVLMQFQSFPKYAKLDDGSVYVRVYGDASTEKNDEVEQALEGNFSLIKERLLNPLNEQFIADIKTKRPNVTDAHLKGRSFPASEVIGTLIDSIGTFNTAVEKVIELSAAKKTTKPSQTSQGSQTSQVSQSSQNQPKNITNMKFPQLNGINPISGFEMVDGYASFNDEQLSEIESALLAGSQAIARSQTLDGQIAILNSSITAKDSRITELESSLAAALGDNADSSAVVDNQTDAGSASTEVDAFASAREFCKNHLKAIN